MAANQKKRTVTLTDRRPVTIIEGDWPVVAKATGDSYGSNDYARYEQARSQGELDEWAIRVRQHEDGRAIVYAVFDAATAWTNSEDRRGGELLGPEVDDRGLVDASCRVGADVRIPDGTIRECVADLPAETL